MAQFQYSLFTKCIYVQIYRGNIEKKTRIKGEGEQARSRVNCAATNVVLQTGSKIRQRALNAVRLDAPLGLPATRRK